MKVKKVIALILAASMVAAVAGCSKVKKITGADFVAACEKMGAQEVDYDDTTADVDEDAIEDGIYCVLDNDNIEEIYEEYGSSSSSMMYGISAPDFDSIIEADDIEEATVFAKVEQNMEDIDDVEDIADLNVNAVIGVQFTLTDAGMVEQIMEGLADNLDEYDIDVEDLGSDEYYVSKNEGYLKIHVSVEDFVAAFLESETCGYLEAMDLDIEEMVDGMTGDICIATYINGENLVVVIGGSVNNTVEYLDEFCGYLGIPSPSKLGSNTMVAEAICDTIDDTIGAMLGAFASYDAYDY